MDQVIEVGASLATRGDFHMATDNVAPDAEVRLCPYAGIVRHLRSAGPRTNVSAVLRRGRWPLKGSTPLTRISRSGSQLKPQIIPRR